MKTITYNNTKDIAIRVINSLVNKGLLKNNDDPYFKIQDVIQDEINDFLGLNIDDDFEIEYKLKRVTK
jgi:hypothetical protein